MKRPDDPVELVAVGLPVLAEFAAVTLFIGLIAVLVALRAGA